jgi:protein-S-isoprenylcysteine O-methyltransferase Ste14
MSGITLNYVLIAWLLLAAAVFASLFFVNAPYGRYTGRNFGPVLKGRLGWIIMEAPAPLVFAAFFLNGLETITVTQAVFFVMWEAHYVDRAFIYPMTLRLSSKPIPVVIVGAGAIFNIMNAYLNGGYITSNTAQYSAGWLSDIRFFTGLALFITGYIINRNSDIILYRLRRSSPSEYSLPQGGFFRWVSCPNYLGEITIWMGWTLATWSPVAAAFTLWTIANLAPRARAHHRWYREHFERRGKLPRDYEADAAVAHAADEKVYDDEDMWKKGWE